jgi:integrase
MRAKGTGGVYLRGSTWWISYSVRGEQRRESAKSTNRADATRLLKLRTAETVRGYVTGHALRLGNLADRLHDHYVINERKSLRRIDQSLAHLRAFFGDEFKADKLNDEIAAYIAHRRAAGIANSTINRELTALKTAMRLGKLVPDFKLLHEDNRRTGFFEPDQFGAIMHELPDYLRGAIHALYLTGWRPMEMLTRRWEHVDFDAGWLRLDPGESKNSEGRMFPMLPELRAMLERQWKSASEIQERTGVAVDYVFHYPDGRPIGQYARAWKSACDRAGLDGKLVYDMRRTAVRNLIRAGASQVEAMAITGHKTISIFQRYAIVDETLMRATGAKLAAHHAREDRTYGLTKGDVERLAKKAAEIVEPA